jgi:hypothetical protein
VGVLERGIPFPVYIDNPNKYTLHDSLRDEDFFRGGWMRNQQLKCGCADEWRCIHFQWPAWTGDEVEEMGGGRILDLEGVHGSGELSRQSLDNSLGMGVEYIQPSGGHPGRAAEDRSIEDNGVAVGENSNVVARGISLHAEEKQINAEIVMGNTGIRPPESNLSSMEEEHDLAKMALEAFRILSPAA